jgi:hypothetical protein
MYCTRMIIAEAASDERTTAVVARMHKQVQGIAGLVGHSILVEEGGRMVDSDYGLAKPAGLFGVPREPGVSPVRCRNPSHAGRGLRR